MENNGPPSVIIVIVFLIASLSLNNIFRGTLNSDDAALRNRINELTYFVNYDKVKIPFYEDTPLWDIAIETKEGENVIEILNKKNGKKSRLKLAR